MEARENTRPDLETEQAGRLEPAVLNGAAECYYHDKLTRGPLSSRLGPTGRPFGCAPPLRPWCGAWSACTRVIQGASGGQGYVDEPSLLRETPFATVDVETTGFSPSTVTGS